MKKIAILTRRAGYNMGTSLQAVAMSVFIDKAGFPNRIIDYDEYSGHILWRIKPRLNRIIYFIMHLCPRLSKLAFGKKFLRLQVAQKQMRRFHKFEKEFMPLTDKKYKSYRALERDFNNYDACICGSDQIWSPYFYDSVFLLSFIKKGSKCRKIAYAPSMGITDASMLRLEQIDLMTQFDSISCRENEASAIVKKVTGKNVPTVLDPTLMVDPEVWSQMADKASIATNGEKYILTYFLHTNYYRDVIPNDFIKKLKSVTKLPVYNISLFNLENRVNADIDFNDIGPLEFLALVKGAEWICTNSFHCGIFSYMFKRRFFVFERYMKDGNDGGNQNSRIYNLLKLFGLEQCLTKPEAEPNLSQKFDFNFSKTLVDEARSRSLDFLKASLS